MIELIDGVRRFNQEIMPHYQDLFSRLADGQRPEALWIGCSDSRIDPHLITQSRPGTLFVARNPGNIVPPHGQQSGVGAAIEYAVDVLGVRDVIVCGHAGCGAMQGVLAPQSVAALPQVRELIAQAWQPPSETSAPSLSRAIEQNVVLQLDRVSQFPSVSQRLAQGRISVHGWVYEIGTGQVKAYDGNGFMDLVDAGCAPARPTARSRRASARGGL